ncbi:DUF58 domain-containing protein [Thiospirochaeta perfilievii]|uniref:DUF58 domain-containing protein n=1 Tax=Thiospirochaeta perfilievii TaxID=252967 RepID=A0A5C1QCF5_9SPIO|nr:DUF58 domain-containing protein [Thiospirochaeta perfilievii]QEN04790.1 DUF58 domain-containing protein [Thiospirochaeta perfilievii]
MKLKINIFNIMFYFILWFILFLLGNYIGGLYSFLYIFLTLSLIFNFLHFIITINNLYYYQQFSIEHPIKGQNIEYTLTVENRFFLIPSIVQIKFNSALNLDDVNLNLKALSSLKIKNSFALPYRGIYRVGIKKILCTDLFNIFTYSISFWPRTFYVYPKINRDIKRIKRGFGENISQNLRSKNNSTEFLETVEDYTINSKVNLISWKHFATYNEPYVKKFSSEESSYSYIFLDRTILPEDRKGPADDLSIEIFYSLIKLNIENNEVVKTNYWPNLKIKKESFKSIYKESIYISFDQQENSTLVDFRKQNYDCISNITIITTLESTFFFDFEFLEKYINITIYIITSKFNRKKYRLLSKYINNFGDKANIICIEK